ncbi:hypothetical protein H0O01_03180 [Candidatus Micrarchaeota archaeon]|nr:hypothetical protein [Candidatus Micrarchaeota archaeon]
MALPLAYELVMGKPIIFWLGILTALFLFSAGIVMILTFHTKYKFPVDLHHKLAFIGLAFAIIHVILALSIYL